MQYTMNPKFHTWRKNMYIALPKNIFQMDENQLTEEQKKEIERIKKVDEKARKLADAFSNDIKNNSQAGSGSVYLYHNTWVVKPHSFTKSNDTLSID